MSTASNRPKLCCSPANCYPTLSCMRRPRSRSSSWSLIRLRIEVHDGFSMTEAFRGLVDTEVDIGALDPSAPSGRGLVIVRSSAVRFGVLDKGAGGKAVWFEVAIGR